MTLFKKVFQKHLEEQAALAEQSEPWPDTPPPPVELAPPPAMAEPAPAVHPGLPEMSGRTRGAEQEPAAPVPPAPLAEAPPPELDPALVARAAEAHRMMVETRSTQPPPDPQAPLPGRAVPEAASPAPSAPQPSSRTRTRLLGFGGDAAGAADPLAAAATKAGPTPFPCGWLVVTDGPGRGQCFTLTAGVSMIGRGEDQAICLDFGDRAISRQNHAAVAYDPETGKFYLGHGGKSNIIRLNGQPVLSTEDLTHGATIRIGETTLRFAAFCDASFTWSDGEQ